MSNQTSSLVRAAAPRGFPDREGADIAAAEAMMAKIRGVYSLYGFEAVETPFVEYTEALGKFLPDLDRPNEGVFSFKDDDEQWLSLRYDLTAPLARYFAENFERLPKPYRSYRAGWVFRNEKPGPGRFRQFMQFDADTVGSASPAADAEMCMMAADALEALGVKRGDYVIKLNNRKVLDGVMEAIGLGGAENAGRRLTVLRAIDKLDRLGTHGVRALLGEGRKDESGDFTRGAALGELQLTTIMKWLNFDKIFTETQPGGGAGFGVPNPYYLPPLSWPEAFKSVINMFTGMNRRGVARRAAANWDKLGALAILFEGSALLNDGLGELEEIADLIEAAGYGDGRIVIDPSVVRGLEYYTGPVFEAELSFEVKDEAGRPVRFGSVGGGGRYDGLVARFRSEPVPATGFSIGVSRLLAALRAMNSPIVAEAATPGPVVVLVLDRDRMADYQRLVATLRGAGIASEFYLGAAGMNAQLKYADRRRSLCAVIQGSNERDAPGGPRVVVRDLALGAELAKASKDRSDYLEMRQRAQIAAPEAELVQRVREVLARGGAPLLGT
jgi:histidyl-tRNA synthetase